MQHCSVRRATQPAPPLCSTLPSRQSANPLPVSQRSSPGRPKPVPRFYFHFASAQRFVYDDHGAELPSLRSAHMHAVGLVARTVRLMDPADKERWTVQIAGENGGLLLTVMFPAVRLRPAAFGREREPAPHLTQNTPAVLRAYAASLRESPAPIDGPGADPA